MIWEITPSVLWGFFTDEVYKGLACQPAVAAPGCFERGVLNRGYFLKGKGCCGHFGTCSVGVAFGVMLQNKLKRD